MFAHGPSTLPSIWRAATLQIEKGRLHRRPRSRRCAGVENLPRGPEVAICSPAARGLAAPKFPIMRMPFSRQGPRVPGNMRGPGGAIAAGGVASFFKLTSARVLGDVSNIRKRGPDGLQARL